MIHNLSTYIINHLSAGLDVSLFKGVGTTSDLLEDLLRLLVRGGRVYQSGPNITLKGMVDFGLANGTSWVLLLLVPSTWRHPQVFEPAELNCHRCSQILLKAPRLSQSSSPILFFQ